MAKWVGFLGLGVVALGCGASLEHVTASETGCASSHITITDDHQGWNTRSWTAECNGDLYYCMGMQGHVSCKQATGDEVEGNAPKPTVKPGGCDFDNQCKGERICRERKCVDP